MNTDLREEVELIEALEERDEVEADKLSPEIL